MTCFRWILCALFLLIIGFQQLEGADLISNGGFETPVNTSGPLPTGYGYWRFNDGMSTGTANGIVPFEGSNMLQFIYTNTGGPNAVGNACDIYQLIDVSAYTAEIRAGLAKATLSGYFNRVAGDIETTDTAFALNLWAYAGDPATFPSQVTHSELGKVQGYLLSDGDPETWELSVATMMLPTATDFLAVRIVAVENIFNNATAPEFDGHYADRISLSMEIIPEPMSLALLGLGLGAMFCRKVSAARRS